MNYSIFKNALKRYNISFNDGCIKNHRESIRHMIRCYYVAKEFGIYLNLSKKEQRKLRECALLHDLGKLNIDPKILYKKEKITDDEFMYIKTHTQIENLNNTLDDCILDCIKYHHDNVICTGYNKIDVSTKHDFVKIISLIDCFDVMGNKRSYKDYILSIDEIILQIESKLGKQFDYYYGHKFICFIEYKYKKALSC